MVKVLTDWRLPENRREAFQRNYTFTLRYRAHPGCVYALLPAIANHYEADREQAAWLAWLNGNTQNVVSTMLLFEAAPRPELWRDAVAFWNDHFTDLEWDTDRRRQKSKFGEATEALMGQYAPDSLADNWGAAGESGWPTVWRWAKAQPHMGRLSAWSMIEYARILGLGVPDAADFMLEDKSGSRSHRNGIALVAGYESTYWDADTPDMLGIVGQLNDYVEDLLYEQQRLSADEPWVGDVSRLTLESALCTYKSWHKPNRRYPGVYIDMMYNRIRRAEQRFGQRFELLWRERARLPHWLLVEQGAEGLSPEKQNHYLTTGQIPVLWRQWPDMDVVRW